ncbi:MAG: hypothetical protein PSV46_18090 [Reyranella sp.]|nr:hypothetical protein [Reyranella sp.]
MTSFLSLSAYSAPVVLLLGLSTFAGCMGLGLLLLRLLRTELPAPFGQVVAVLLGIQVTGLAVQIVAMAQAATPTVLIVLWGVSLAGGAVGWIFCRPIRDASALPAIPRIAIPRIAIVIAVVAAGLNLLAAIVPSSKIDELYYHMLLPARVVADHGLTIYRTPIESAVLPQMAYAFFAAPLHVLGYPDAPNVVSWMLSLTLVWFGWTILRQRGIANPVAYCLVAALLVGAYPMVFHVTGGSHAFGDLSLAAAVVALALADRLLAACGSVRFAFMVSLLAWSAASAKVSLMPLAGAVALLAIFFATRASSAFGARIRILAAAGAPWLILGAPLMIWTYARTGSPFGPLLAGLFGESLFRPEIFADFAASTRIANRSPLGAVLFDNLAGYSPLVWVAAIGALISGPTPLAVRRWGTALLLGQCLIIAWLLPYHARFLGGLQYGLAICFALYLPPQLIPWKRATAIAIAIGVLPWMAGQAAYTQQFAAMALGLENRSAFARRYVAFFDDFISLDRLLPANAVLLATDSRPPAVYASRPMVFDLADVPPGREVYVFSVGLPNASDYPAPYTLGPEIYANSKARQTVFRRPWAAPETGELHVVRLARP